jgi:N-acyl-L-homoserine lactone synthetase
MIRTIAEVAPLTGVQLADAAAPQFIARAVPLRFGPAESAFEREAIYRLRYEIAVEHGWEASAAGDSPDGLVRDPNDDDALHIAGWDGEQVIAASRLVFPRAGRLLPTEETFDIEIEPRGQVVDWSRLIVARSHSDLGHGVFAALLSTSWLEMRSRGFSMLCGDLSKGMIRLYRRLGFDIHLLGSPRLYWGERRYPARVALPRAATPELIAR